jgi:HTH-type transcriptional regulator / antitoxin HigA
MLKPIKSDKEHEEYLDRAYSLMQKDIKPDSEESDELELISILIEAYEKNVVRIDPPNPVEAILFRLYQLGMKKTDLNRILGSRSRVSEILLGKRRLSLNMIRKLNAQLGIPAQILIKDYKPFNVT